LSCVVTLTCAPAIGAAETPIAANSIAASQTHGALPKGEPSARLTIKNFF